MVARNPVSDFARKMDQEASRQKRSRIGRTGQQKKESEGLHILVTDYDFRFL
jgi:hypothetical protein